MTLFCHFLTLFSSLDPFYQKIHLFLIKFVPDLPLRYMPDTAGICEACGQKMPWGLLGCVRLGPFIETLTHTNVFTNCNSPTVMFEPLLPGGGRYLWEKGRAGVGEGDRVIIMCHVLAMRRRCERIDRSNGNLHK